MIKSRTKTSVSQSHGDWTDPAAVQTLSLTQQSRNTFIWSYNKHQFCWFLSLLIFNYDFVWNHFYLLLFSVLHVEIQFCQFWSYNTLVNSFYFLLYGILCLQFILIFLSNLLWSAPLNIFLNQCNKCIDLRSSLIMQILTASYKHILQFQSRW